MDGASIGIISGVIIGGMALFTAVIKLIDYIVKKKNDKYLIGKLTDIIKSNDDTHEIVEKLLEMHDRYDTDGSPLWYVPRSWYDIQEKILELIHLEANKLERIEQTLQILERRINGKKHD